MTDDVGTAAEAVEEIATRVESAKRLLNEAKALAHKFDIPFYSNLQTTDVRDWDESAGWNDSGCSDEWQDSGC